jgi:hypothetical protein
LRNQAAQHSRHRSVRRNKQKLRFCSFRHQSRPSSSDLKATLPVPLARRRRDPKGHETSRPLSSATARSPIRTFSPRVRKLASDQVLRSTARYGGVQTRRASGKLLARPCRRATCEATAPGANVSDTKCSFSSSLRQRRRFLPWSQRSAPTEPTCGLHWSLRSLIADQPPARRP